MLNGILIVAAMLIIGAFLSARRARRRETRLRDAHVRAGSDGGASDLPAFMFFSDASRGEGHDHHPGDPTGDWPAGSDGGSSGGAGASGSFDGGADGGGSSDAGGGTDGGSGGGDGGGGGSD